MANPEQYDFYITTPNLKLGAQDLPPSHHLSFFNETDIRLGTKTEALSDLPHPSELLPPSESDIPEFDPSELLPDYDPKFNMNLVVDLDLLSSEFTDADILRKSNWAVLGYWHSISSYSEASITEAGNHYKEIPLIIYESRHKIGQLTKLTVAQPIGTLPQEERDKFQEVLRDLYSEENGRFLRSFVYASVDLNGNRVVRSNAVNSELFDNDYEYIEEPSAFTMTSDFHPDIIPTLDWQAMERLHTAFYEKAIGKLIQKFSS